MTIYHKHHIIPEHMGGTDDPENLVKVTLEEHIALHKQLWEDLGHKGDLIAWQALSGLLTISEIKKLALSLGPKKGGEKCKIEKIGYLAMTKEENIAAGKKSVKMKVGIHSDSWDKAIGGKKGGNVCKEKKIGFLAEGFDLGKASRGKIWIHMKDVEMKIPPTEMKKYLEQGWEKGRKCGFRKNKNV